MRDLGRTGLKSSLLGFGAMRIPESSREEAVATVRLAVELGINYFETSPGYGDSELFIGEALDGHPRRDDLIVSTKSHAGGDKTADDLRRRLDSSLERLRVGRLRFYQMWGINDMELFEVVMSKGGPLEGARKAQDEGLIDHIGFTTHALPEDTITMLDSGEFESVSVLCNIIDRRALPAVERAAELGMGVVHMVPLSQGMLARPSEGLTQAFGGRDTREVALHYLAGLPQTSTVIAGPKNRQELEQNAAAMEVFTGWGDDEQALLERAEGHYKKLGPDHCTLCRRCLPCPQDVNIPELLRLNNLLVAFGLEDYCKDRYAFMGNGGSWFPGVKADRCNECGYCEPRCPEGIRIVHLLKQLHAKLYAGERGRIADE